MGTERPGINGGPRRTVYDALNVPYAAWFLDVQHWFFRRSWLHDMALQIEAKHGSMAKGICAVGTSYTTFNTFETLVAFSYLYNRSRAEPALGTLTRGDVCMIQAPRAHGSTERGTHYNVSI